MLDLGAEPYLLASGLLGVLAQRLVRRICPDCKEQFEAGPEQLGAWGMVAGELPVRTVYRGRGCAGCLDTGYRERIGVFELLSVTESIRELVLQRGKASTIKAEAIVHGMTTLRADGLHKAVAGITTMDEVARVTARDEF